ncbi:MAG TPA: ECF-type sigma factor [Planctomycetota bacterium]|nr:ECF-type sigma factor [Planctomycetota bacterium]
MSNAIDRLGETLYAGLLELAQRQLRRGRTPGQIEAADLVHEAYLKLAGATRLYGLDKPQFLGLAAKVLRQVLVDRAREEQAAKRGGQWRRITLHDALDVSESTNVDLLALDEALARLAALSERQARVVELRYFSGLSIDETAEVLGVSPRTVDGDWLVARAWLKRELSR